MKGAPWRHSSGDWTELKGVGAKRTEEPNLARMGPQLEALGPEQVPQRNCVTKILPNIRVNFLV